MKTAKPAASTTPTMEFVIDPGHLARAITFVARVLPKKPTVPVLAGIRLRVTEDGEFSACAFDWEIAGIAREEATVTVPGQRLVSGAMLAEIVKNLPAGKDVVISSDDTRLYIKAGAAKFLLMLLPDDEYPPIYEMPPLTATLTSSDLLPALAAVTTAAGKDDTLPALTAVLFTPGDGEIVLRATDRYRATQVTIPATTQCDTVPPTVLIAASTLNALTRSLAGADKISFGVKVENGTPTLAGFATDEFTLVTRLVTGEFPASVGKRINEFTTNMEIVIPQAPFAAALKRVTITAGKNEPVRLIFHDGQVTARTVDGEIAEGSDVLDCDYRGTEPVMFKFNPLYLLAGISQITGNVHLAITGPNQAVLVTQAPAEDGTTTSYQYLLMPIKGNDTAS